MKFTGETKVELDRVVLAELHGRERRCVECNQPFDNGDLVVMFSASVYQDDTVPLEDVYLVHVKRKLPTGGTCVDDFVARVINSFPSELAGEAPPAPTPAGPAPDAPPSEPPVSPAP